MRAFAVQDHSVIGEVRRAAVAVAGDIGFDAGEAGRVAIVATELATNLVRHAAAGEILVGIFEDETGSGLECLALDRGPGMADVSAAMRDGFSTAGSAGTGLGAIRRQSHRLAIYSRPGAGTAVLARMERGQPPPEPASPTPLHGAVNVPKPGEQVCGDAWSVRASDRGTALLLLDGLGHGPLAASAAHAGIRAFEAAPPPPPGDLLRRLHAALRPTRGATGSAAELRGETGSVIFAGIGNVAGAIVTGDNLTRRMVTHNGTLGHAMKRVQEFVYPFEAGSLVILASDGLGTGWTLDAYPGLRECHPSLIAGVLYRDFAHGRDDVTVLVARGGPA